MRPPFRSVTLYLAGWLVSAASLLALDPAKSIFQFNCKNWTRLSGLPADQINAIAQDDNGYIWLGSQNGLVRFDGQSFSVIPVDLPSARGTNVTSLRMARDGVLWFSIWQGGFGGFDDGKFLPFGVDGWSDASDATSLMIGRDGAALWTGTVTGLGRWTPGAPQRSLPVHEITTILGMWEEPSGRVWLGTPQRGLHYFENGVITVFSDDRLKSTNIHAITRDKQNDLWVGTNRGLFQYDPELRPKAVHYPEAQHTSLLVDGHGILWVGTNGLGLLRYHKGEFTRLGRVEGLGSDNITALLEDREASLWVGTTEGVSQVSDLKFPIFSATEGLVQGSATSVAAAPGGGLWMGTNTGASFFDGARAINLQDRSILPTPYVRRVFVAENGDVYLGDGSRNLIVLRDGKVLVRFANQLWPEAFLDDGDGVLVGVGTTLYRIQGDAMVPYEFEGTAPDFNWFNDLARGTDGSVWAATNAGLFRIEGRKAQRWSEADGLSSPRIHCLIADPEGGVWCGMTMGLLRMNNGRMTQISIRDGLRDGRIFAMVADQHGSFWLSSSQGILRVSRENLLDFVSGDVTRIECAAFDGLESVKVVDRSDQGYSGCRTMDGRIWFPTPRGIVMIDPKGHFINKVPPKVRIERVQVDNRAVSETEATKLGGIAQSVEFSFSALSFIAPDKTQVRYQLEGFDRDWIEGGNRRKVTYNNLPAGKYVFRLRAANADGVWSTETSDFALSFPPPYYQQTWFYLVCGLTTVLGLYGGYQVKVRRLSQQQRRLQMENDKLEEKVRERTDELASSVSLLQATLDSTADGIFAAKYSGDVVSHNSQFQQMWRLPASLAATASGAEVNRFLSTQVKDPAAFMARLAAIDDSKEGEAFDVIELKDGRVLERYCRPQKVEGVRIGVVMNYRDITQRKQAEAKLELAHQQLLETSRRAGMAEVATSVLHNVGNVLNSVNVSATLATDRVRHSKVTSVTRVAEMLQSNAHDLPAFLTSDPKGQKLVPYLSNLGVALRQEQESISTELTHLTKNVEHIKEIVAMQQSFARVSGVCETAEMKDLVEDALRMNSTSLNRHHVDIVRDYASVPQITIDRHKVMQILVNLISNAKDACNQSDSPDKTIILRTTAADGRVQFSVTDNGVGIPRENLTRIFAHGFTTKKEGHGFGLHSAALTANELGGSLLAKSEGVGCGATFILDVPQTPTTSDTRTHSPDEAAVTSDKT